MHRSRRPCSVGRKEGRKTTTCRADECDMHSWVRQKQLTHHSMMMSRTYTVSFSLRRTSTMKLLGIVLTRRSVVCPAS